MQEVVFIEDLVLGAGGHTVIIEEIGSMEDELPGHIVVGIVGHHLYFYIFIFLTISDVVNPYVPQKDP